MADSAPGTRLIRTAGGTIVEGLHPEVLSSVYGARQPVPQVEAAAVSLITMFRSFNIFTSERSSARAAEIILRYYDIHNGQLSDLINILSRLGYSKQFFQLALPRNGDVLKRYLLNNGILWDTVMLYHEFDIWDGAEFATGFVVGLGESFASILVALKELFEFGIESFQNRSEAVQKIRDFISELRQLTKEKIIQVAISEFSNWNNEFSEALFDLRFDIAGYKLGKLGGDLFQLFAGVAALAKLPGMTIKLAKRFIPLFVAGARRSAAGLKLLGELVIKIGRQAFLKAPSLGMRALNNLIDVEALKNILNGALMAFDKYGRTIFRLDDLWQTLEAPGGIRMPVMAIAEESMIVAKVEGKAAGILTPDETISELIKLPRRTPVATSAELFKAVERVKELSKALLKEWRETVAEILREGKIKIRRGEIGTWIHSLIKDDFLDFAKLNFPQFRPSAEVSLKNLGKQLGLLSKCLKRLETPVVEFIKKDKEIMKTLGAKNEKELIDILSQKFGYKKATTLGDVISDGVLIDEKTATLISIDWTSGWGHYRFAQELEKLIATGKNISDYKRDVQILIDKFLSHAVRENVVRRSILEYIFEEWSVEVLEITYDPIKLIK